MDSEPAAGVTQVSNGNALYKGQILWSLYDNGGKNECLICDGMPVKQIQRPD